MNSPRRKRASEWLFLLIAAVPAGFGVFELYAQSQFDILIILFLLAHLSVIWVTFRTFNLLDRLSEKAAREELSLTGLDASDYLSGKLIPPFRRAIVPFVWIAALLCAAQLIYEVGMDLGRAPETISGGVLYTICFFMFAASGFLILFGGICRMLVTHCRSRNRNRYAGFYIYIAAALWIAAAIALPWIATVGGLAMILDGLQIDREATQFLLPGILFALLAMSYGFCLWSWTRACKFYYLFESP